MKKVILLSEYVSPTDNSTGYYWHGIIRGLASSYGTIKVICPEQRTDAFRQNIGAADFVFIKKRSLSDKNLFMRVLGQASTALAFAWHLLSQVRKDDVVICGTNPALFVLLVPILKMIKPFRWLLVAHDVFPENLVPARILSTSNHLYFIVKKYSDWAYSQADRIIVIGRDMQCLMDKKICSTGRTRLIPNWACPDEIAILPKKEALFIDRLGWEGKVVFQFFGNMGRVQGINNILSAIRLVTHPQASFLFIGDGVMVPHIKEFIEKNPDRCAAYFEPTAVEERARVLAACDVAFITLERGMLGLGVPSKSYFSLAADKPLLVLSDFGSEISKVVAEDDVGWWCKPDNPQMLSSLIDYICSLNLSTYSGRPRRVLVEKYSDNISLDKYRHVVHELIAD